MLMLRGLSMSIGFCFYPMKWFERNTNFVFIFIDLSVKFEGTVLLGD